MDVGRRLCDGGKVPRIWTLAGHGSESRRAVLTIWVIVNLVNLLQAVGFASRVSAPDVQRVVGIAIGTLAVPATFALAEFVRTNADRRFLAGPISFDAFVIMMLVIDYWLEVEFRSPRKPAVLVPYVVLFFGSIVLMGAPMLRMNRRLWLVTVATTGVHLLAMGYAMSQGVG